VTNPTPHGAGVRGFNLAPSSRFFNGRFGRMFRALPPADFGDTDDDSQNALKKLGLAMVSDEDPPKDGPDNEESGIPAAYTYLGQFIDHDLTFDPASSLQRQNDPDALIDFRTPRFDLDSVYGRGPDDQPYLYADGRKFQLGDALTGDALGQPLNAHDLPRSSATPARAIIGDPRNDENVIVSQLQGLFLRFHNKVANDHSTASFADVQQEVRFHYQWVVLNDFLATIVEHDVLHQILPHLHEGSNVRLHPPQLAFYHFTNDMFMPLEFSAAAYRFGHSMVRPIYRLNTTLGVDPPTPDDPVNGRQFIFHPDDDTQSLNGFRAFPSTWAIEWNLFFDMGDHLPNVGVKRLQRAYKIDTSLVNALGRLPTSFGFPEDLRSLAERNLLRGLSMGLPSGQDVARAMGAPIIDDDHLKVGKATEESQATNPRLVDIRDFGPEFIGKAPLWFYVLAEAQQQFKKDDTPIRLGPVGGRIVAETFIGLLLGDPHSFLNQSPEWKPNRSGTFTMADLIRTATSPR
jgi:hypothetical protein